MQVLLRKRNIATDSSQINERTPFVQRYILNKRIKRSDEATIDSVVMRARSENNDYLTLTFAQAVMLGLLARGFFKLTKTSIETKFDVSVPEEYWNIANIRKIIENSKQNLG
jgi:hypothetical protein